MSENVSDLIRRLEQNLVVTPDDVDLRQRLADAHDRAGDLRAAGQQFKEIGRIHLRRMRLPNAVDALKRAAEHLPDDFRALEQLYAIHRLAENEEAMVQVGVILADKLRRARQPERAEEILLRCLQVGDEQPDARRVLMETYAGSGRPDKALPHAQLLAEKHPDERERKKFAKLAAELPKQPVRQMTPRPSGGAIATPPPASRTTPADRSARGRLGWVAAAVAAAAVAGFGALGHVEASAARAAVAEATTLARGGDLEGAADRLQDGGMRSLALQARAAGQARALVSEFARLARAEQEGLRGLPAIRDLVANGSPRVRTAAEAALPQIAAIEGLVTSLRAALEGDDPAAGFDPWAALRDRGHLATLPVDAPDLARLSLPITLTTTPAGAEVRRNGEPVGETPLQVKLPIVGSHVLELRLGTDAATIDLADAPSVQWAVPLSRARAWRVPTSGAITGLHVRGGLVAAGSDLRELVCADRETGTVRWRASLGAGGDVLGAPWLDGEQVWATTGDGRLVRRRVDDGSPLDDRVFRDILTPPLAHPDGGVVVLASGGRILHVQPEPKPIAEVAGARWLSRLEKVLYVVGPTAVSALNLADGSVVWRQDLGGPFGGPVHVAGTWLVVPRPMRGFAVLERDGTPQRDGRWARAGSGAAVAVGGALVVGGASGGVMRASPAAGVASRLRHGIAPAYGSVVGLVVDPQGLIHATSATGWYAVFPLEENATGPAGWSTRLLAPATTAPHLDALGSVIGTAEGLVALVGRN